MAARIETVEAELAKLAVEYVDRASMLEEEGRLAESILDFRLALELEPDNQEAVRLLAIVRRG